MVERRLEALLGLIRAQTAEQEQRFAEVEALMALIMELVEH